MSAQQDPQARAIAGWPDPNASRAEVDAFRRARRQTVLEGWAKGPTAFCPLCGLHLVERHNETPGAHHLTCPEDCGFVVAIKVIDPCTNCGHKHAGKSLAGICVGCVCPFVGGKDVVVHAVVQSGAGDIETRWKLPNKEAAPAGAPITSEGGP